MAPNLTSGTFKIVSLIDGNPPTSINFMLPGFQLIYLSGPVTTWAVDQERYNTYRFRVGRYPYTGIFDKKVIASIFPEQNVEWIVTYRELQDAYTISPINDDTVGWTVACDDPNSEITLRPIISTKSIPLQLLPSRLFRFEEIGE